MALTVKDLCLDMAGKTFRNVPFASRLGAFSSGNRLVLRPFPGFRRAGEQKSQIIMYHRVLPKPEPFSIDPALVPDFRRQMRLLRDRFHPVPLREIVAAWESGEDIPGAVAVTFDDGYADNFRHAFPILKEFGIPATIFLATDFIGTGQVPWHDRVLGHFRDARAPTFAYPEAGIAETPMGDAPQRRDLAFRILGWLKRFTPGERDAHIAAVAGKCSPSAASGETLMLDWNQVREMLPHGISFGAHTMSHPIISRLTPEAVEAEVLGSKMAIERETGTKVDLFAYPNGQPGDYNPDCKTILKKLGFACAVTTSPGVATRSSDRFGLARRHVWDATTDGFYCRLLLERLIA